MQPRKKKSKKSKERTRWVCQLGGRVGSGTLCFGSCTGRSVYSIIYEVLRILDGDPDSAAHFDADPELTFHLMRIRIHNPSFIIYITVP